VIAVRAPGSVVAAATAGPPNPLSIQASATLAKPPVCGLTQPVWAKSSASSPAAPKQKAPLDVK
jgi:hypothetical protein